MQRATLLVCDVVNLAPTSRVRLHSARRRTPMLPMPAPAHPFSYLGGLSRRAACSHPIVNMGRDGNQGISEPAADNIRTIVDLEREAHREARPSERIGEAITRFAGTMSFALAHVFGFVLWALWNRFAPEALRFDPYPYPLLTFFVSMEAVLVSTFVLIAQNRMSRQTDRRDHLNLQIDLLTEQEMTIMLRLLRRLAAHLQVESEHDDLDRAEKLTASTNVYELMRTLKRELPDEKT
jgi:uncharacterized membrane protein